MRKQNSELWEKVFVAAITGLISNSNVNQYAESFPTEIVDLAVSIANKAEKAAWKAAGND